MAPRQPVVSCSEGEQVTHTAPLLGKLTRLCYNQLSCSELGFSCFAYLSWLTEYPTQGSNRSLS